MSEDFKNVVMVLLLGISGFLGWFLKKIYAEHALVFEHYTKTKGNDLHKMLLEIETIKLDLKRVESDSKRYWSEQNKQIESNQIILLERINHSSDNNKAGTTMVIDYFQRLEKKVDKLEDRFNSLQ